jgi:DNA processing protein
MSDLRYWIALNLIPDIGPVRVRRLLSAFGNPETLFTVPVGELMGIGDIGEERAGRIAGFQEWERVEREIKFAGQNDVRIVTLHDNLYPVLLRKLSDAPPVLYVRGSLRDTDRYAVAVVGSRHVTHYGTQVSEKIACDLASRGITIVSGMARGVDSASHRGALRAKGRTLAVLGSGIDVLYPPENRNLVRAISSSGAVISEFPFGTLPERGNFPRRNRIISALSLGVVVVEAAVDSGSLITVRYALDQGREVFAVPGNITSRNSKGTNDLIRNGAVLVRNAEDIIEELKPQISGILREEGESYVKSLPRMTSGEKRIYEILDSVPKHIDIITRETEKTSSETLALLLSLELKGIVKQVDGKRFAIM